MQCEARALSRSADDFDFAVMGFYYLLYQREAKSGSPCLGRIIRAEDLLNLVLGNSFSGILDIQQQCVSIPGVRRIFAGMGTETDTGRQASPPGMACMAFRRRLSSTCVIRSASSNTSGQTSGTS